MNHELLALLLGFVSGIVFTLWFFEDEFQIGRRVLRGTKRHTDKF